MTSTNMAKALCFITDLSELHINKSECLVKKKYAGKSQPEPFIFTKQRHVQTNLLCPHKRNMYSHLSSPHKYNFFRTPSDAFEQYKSLSCISYHKFS